MRRRVEARELMFRVNPARMRCGRPLGLRDSALLALVAEGMGAREIAVLRASDIAIVGGRVAIAIPHREGKRSIILEVDHGARLIAWLNDRHLWHTDALVFTAFRGPITVRGISAVLDRYRRRRRNRR